MKTRIQLLRLAIALGFAGILGMTLLFSIEPMLAAPADDGYSVYYVAPGGDCGGMVPCYSTVQAAVDAVDADGEAVKVAQGTYTDLHTVPVPPGYEYPPTTGLITQVVYISKTLSLQGSYSPSDWGHSNPSVYSTTLDAHGQGRVIVIYGAVTVTVSGLHITGGNASQAIAGSAGDGGGIFSISSGVITLDNNTIFDNQAFGGGGGIYAGGMDDYGYGGHLIVTHNSIVRNTSGFSGGGVTAYGQLTLTNSVVEANRADGRQFGDSFGGGVFLSGNAVLEDNRISNNTATLEGGGIYSDGTLVLTRNLILSNTLTAADGVIHGGGGLYLTFSLRSPVQSINNVFAHNRTNGPGGGAIFVFVAELNSIHDTFFDNGASALEFSAWDDRGGRIALTNTVIASHTTGIANLQSDYAWRKQVFINNILWHNTPITISAISSATINVQNQYYGDPAFAVDGYHLTDGSAALNRGVPTDVTTDIDGELRPSGLASDLGADEFQEPPVLPGVPVQIAPPNGTVTTTANITFHWLAGAGGVPQGYNIDLDGMIITTTATSYATNLSDGEHTWRVRAFNVADHSGWSESRTIEVVRHQVYLPLVVKGR